MARRIGGPAVVTVALVMAAVESARGPTFADRGLQDESGSLHAFREHP